MLAVLQSEVVEQEAQPTALVHAGPEGLTEAPAIAARFNELRRLADLEARSDNGRSTTSADDEANPLADISLADGFDVVSADILEPAIEAQDTEENAATENLPEGVPIIEIPTNPFDVSFGTASSPDDQLEDDIAGDLTDGTESLSTQPALPEEPPAPATGESLGDLDIGDIQDLVRQAWEDETAIGDAAKTSEAPSISETDGPAPDLNKQPYDPVLSGGIEMAMEEIAAAVVKSADTEAKVDVEAMKTDIIDAMRAELQAVVESDIRSIVKAAVAEALAEMPVANKTVKKAPAKKAAAKKVAAKRTAASKNAKKAAIKATAPKESDES